MDDIELQKRINKLKIPKFRGIYSRDKLPTNRRNGCYIINMEAANAGSGTHWCCFIVLDDGRNCEYFDPFGMPEPLNVKEFMGSRAAIFSNPIDVQGLKSELCGGFCLYVLYQCMNKKRPLMEVVKRDFFKEYTKNDELIRQFLSNPNFF